MGLVLLRTVGAAGVFVGASWLAAEWLERRISARIITSTEEAMKHPTVTQEVDALFVRTAQRLLADPVTERQIAEFLTRAAAKAEVQEGSLNILAGTLLSQQFKAAGNHIMKELAVMILDDSGLREKLMRLSQGLVSGMDSLSEVEHLHVQITLPTLQPVHTYMHINTDFSPALTLLSEKVRRREGPPLPTPPNEDSSASR